MTPTLDQLKLTPAQMMAVAATGYLVTDDRNRRTYFKLRYRMSGRQKVKYIGANVEKAAKIQAELRLLQQRRNAERNLRRLNERARAHLKAMKRKLEPTLQEFGLTFHGLAVRRPRETR